MEKTTMCHWLIKKMTMGNKISPLSFLTILLLLVALDRFIKFLNFCLTVLDLLQTCIAFISRARGACARCSSSSSSSNLQLNENVDDDDDDGSGGDLLARGDLEMVMEKLGFHSDPDEELGSSQFAMLFEEEPSIGEAKEAFLVFDENRDGYIDAGELNKVLRTLGFALASEAECEKMIQAFDDNGDGRIDFDEFTKLVEKSFC